jgi:integrase
LPTSETFQFNPRSLAGLDSKFKRYEVANGDGLRLRVYPPSKDGKPGAKTFRWFGPACREACCPPEPHRHDFQLGAFDSKRLHGLADAQQKLEELKTPAGHKTAVEALVAGVVPRSPPKADAAERTVGQLADIFYNTVLVNRRKRPLIVKDVLNRDIKASIGDVPLSALTPDAAARPVQAAVARGSVGHAVRVLQVTKQFCRWAASMEHLPRDPAAGLDAENLGAVINQRDRLLTVEELGVVLAALERASIEDSTRTAAKLLLATGLRSRELLTLTWADVDLKEATLSVRPENLKLGLKATRQRKGVAYTVPLSPYSVRFFKKMQRITGKFPYVFSSWGTEGRITDKVVARAMRRARLTDKKLAKLPHFVVHDFRRALASWTSDNFDVSGRCSGTVRRGQRSEDRDRSARQGRRCGRG